MGLLSCSSQRNAPVVHLLSLFLLNDQWLVLPWTAITKLLFSNDKGGMTSDIVLCKGPAQCEINCCFLVSFFLFSSFHFVNSIHVAFMSSGIWSTSSMHQDRETAAAYQNSRRGKGCCNWFVGHNLKYAVIGLNAAVHLLGGKKQNLMTSINFINVLNKLNLHQGKHQVWDV